MFHANPDALAGALSRRIRTGFGIALRAGPDVEYVSSADILAFRSKAGKSLAVLPDREAETVRPLSRILQTLKKHGGWFPIGRGLVLNFHRLVRSAKSPAAGWLLTLENGAQFTLLPGYEKPVLRFLAVADLLRVSPISLQQQYLMKMGIKDLEKNILFMTRDELIATFSTASGSAVVVSVLLANFLWQQIQYIRAGSPSPVDGGNVRSLWYLVKPVLSRIGSLDETDHYKTLSSELAEMAARRLISYREFGLIDDGKWSIGAYNPHVILMAEKEAHYRFLQQMQDYTGATILATGGQPATITSEYFTAALLEKLAQVSLDTAARPARRGKWAAGARMAQSRRTPPPEVVILSLTDYDPYGWALLDTFAGDLKTFGLPKLRVINLSVPKNYRPEELEMMHYDLEKSGDTPPAMLRKWMKRTNGIDGKPWGMEVDVLMMDRNRVKTLILTEGKPFFIVPPPVPGRFWKETEKRRQKLHDQARNTIKRFRR